MMPTFPRIARRHPPWLAMLTAACCALSCNEQPTAPADASGMSIRGVTLADWTASGYASSAADEAIDDISAAGANTLVLIVTYYQNAPSSNGVTRDAQRTPSEPALRAAIAAARSRGLRVSLKLHVDVRSGEWRGLIVPVDARAWYGSYREVVVALARLASEAGVDQFVVGTELASLSGDTERWNDIIAAARAEFDGTLTYAASWDEAHRVGFWQALDCVGVDFYAPVSERDDPGRLEILRAWQLWLLRLERLAAQAGRPVLLTEIGYRSVDGAGRAPYQFDEDGQIDLAEQADLYWAALEAVAAQDFMQGMYWWNWLASGAGGVGDNDYTPKGKPAERELSDAWR